MNLETAIRTRLSETLGPVYFSDLKAHLVRDAVFVVDADVSLIECGVCVAMDDVVRVQALIERGHLRKPSRQERARWADTCDAAWTAIVVQPYVLVQLTRAIGDVS
ncbi:MAG: DUF2288 family protein [Myxococcales bacterium]|nr:DUF2288 family protein [Myxococcales bacterium]